MYPSIRTGCPKKKFLTKNVNFKGFRRSKLKKFREQTPLKIQFYLLDRVFSSVWDVNEVIFKGFKYLIQIFLYLCTFSNTAGTHLT